MGESLQIYHQMSSQHECLFFYSRGEVDICPTGKSKTQKGGKCIGSRTCSHGLPLSEVGGHDPSVEDLDGVVPLGGLANVQAELTKLNVVLHPPAYPDLVADQKNISNLLM